MQTLKESLNIDTDQKKILMKSRQKFIRKSVLKEEIYNYEQQGYKLSSKTKNKAIMKIQKPEIEISYNEFVQLFCEMGFKFIPNLFHSFEDEVKNISDFSFVSVDHESVLICYYLYTDNKKKISDFQELINNIKLNYSDLLKELKSIFGNDKKYKILLCTKNYAISNVDINLIQSLKYYFINDERLEYYINLNKHLGNASKFQLLGNLFAGQKIANLDEVIPAIQGKMGGYTYYSFSIEPEKLLKIGYILHRTDANRNDMPTYQRLIKKSRLKQIETFIKNGGFFPNSVIISIDTNKKGLTFNLSSLQDPNSISKIGLLNLPQRYKSVYVIDGQHRLYGYSNTEYKKTNTIPVVAFLDLAKNEQIKLFMEINENQKSVSKNLRTTLNADLLWDSENPTERNTALFSKIAQELGENADSPLFDRVIIGENNKTEKCCITLDTIRDALDKSGLFNRYKEGDIVQRGIIDLNDNDKNLDNIMNLLYQFFGYIRNDNINEWIKDESENKLVYNISIYGLIKIFADITKIIMSKNNFSVEKIGEHFDEYKPYLDVLLKEINSLSEEQNKELKTSYGGGGRIKYWRTLQGFILNKYPDLNFDGYEEWKKSNTKEFNKQAYSLISDIESHLNTDIKNILIQQFGISKWKISGIPQDLMQKIRKLKTDKEYEDPETDIDEWDCMHLIDYRDVIMNNWQSLFEKKYTEPDVKGRSKKDKTEWLVRLNKMRNNIDHNRSISEDDFVYLNKLHSWILS